MNRFAAAELAGDVDVYDDLLHTDFRDIGPVGFALDRKAWAQRHLGDLTNHEFSVDEPEIRHLDDATVVVTAVQRQRTTAMGRDTSGSFRLGMVAVRDAARALELVGERWTLLILRDAMFAHYTRFSQFQGNLAIAPNILTKRLTALVEAGILEVLPNTHEYVLTEMGQTLKPVVVALTRWGDRWVSAGPVRFVHNNCDTEVEHRFWCPRCASEVEPTDVQVRRRSAQEHQALQAQRQTHS